MARRRNPNLGRSLEEFIQEQRASDAAFAAEFDRLRLARRIRQIREAQHLTQGQLAARVRTTQSAIARLESGRVTPKIDLLQKIAESMGLRLSVEFIATVPHRM